VCCVNFLALLTRGSDAASLAADKRHSPGWSGGPVDPASIDQVLSLIEGISPTDTLEAMTATMLVGAQHAALDCLRRGFHPDQTPAGRALYQSLAFKAMRTFAQLVETLHVGRGKAVVKQEIHVTHQHVTVEAGAAVGLSMLKGRGDQKSNHQSRETRNRSRRHGARRSQ
jgi:hypothetical protein